MVFLVNIYSAKLSHVMSDEHRQELGHLIVILGLLMTSVFAELEYWKEILKCTVSARLLFLAKPLWKLLTYICQQSSQILWRWQEAGISFYKVLNLHFNPNKQVKRNCYYPLIHFFIYFKSVTATLSLSPQVMLYWQRGRNVMFIFLKGIS